MSEWKPTAEWLHNYASGHAGFDDELAARLHACANELLKLNTEQHEHARLKDDFQRMIERNDEAIGKLNELTAQRDNAGKLSEGLEADVTDLKCEVNDLRGRLGRISGLCDEWGPDSDAFALANLLDQIERVAEEPTNPNDISSGLVDGGAAHTEARSEGYSLDEDGRYVLKGRDGEGRVPAAYCEVCGRDREYAETRCSYLKCPLKQS